jgi:uncharacterized protein (DUF1330 family)
VRAHTEERVAKAYWICFYQSVANPAAVAEYAKLAGPAIQDGGGRFLGRGEPAKTFEAGRTQRTVVIEFPSVQAAVATYEGEGYKAALRALGDAAVRDIRIIEALP